MGVGTLIRLVVLLLWTSMSAVVGSGVFANPFHEMSEAEFLDLVDQESSVLVQGRGVDAVNSKAILEGLTLPALGFWSVEGDCFRKPPSGECNGVFQR